MPWTDLRTWTSALTRFNSQPPAAAASHAAAAAATYRPGHHVVLHTLPAEAGSVPGVAAVIGRPRQAQGTPKARPRDAQRDSDYGELQRVTGGHWRPLAATGGYGMVTRVGSRDAPRCLGRRTRRRHSAGPAWPHMRGPPGRVPAMSALACPCCAAACVALLRYRLLTSPVLLGPRSALCTPSGQVQHDAVFTSEPCSSRCTIRSALTATA